MNQDHQMLGKEIGKLLKDSDTPQPDLDPQKPEGRLAAILPTSGHGFLTDYVFARRGYFNNLIRMKARWST